MNPISISPSEWNIHLSKAASDQNSCVAYKGNHIIVIDKKKLQENPNKYDNFKIYEFHEILKLTDILLSENKMFAGKEKMLDSVRILTERNKLEGKIVQQFAEMLIPKEFTPINIEEGQVKVLKPNQKAVYTNIDSCITLTLQLKNGTMVGAHLVKEFDPKLHPAINKLPKSQIMDEIKKYIKDNSDIKKIYILGEANNWNRKELSENEQDLRGGENIALYLSKEFNIEDVTFFDGRGEFYVTPDEHLPVWGLTNKKGEKIEDKQLTENDLTSPFSEDFTFQDWKNYFKKKE